MRFLMILLIALLSSCSSEQTPNQNTTQVTVNFGSSLASGALLPSGQVPSNVASITVQAFSAPNNPTSSPIAMQAPNFSATLIVPNGNSIHFKATAYDANGRIVYEGVSAPYNLTGTPQTVFITLSLSITLQATQTSVPRSASVSITGFIAGTIPTATSPLVWAATGGVVTIVPGSNGGQVSWRAPTTLGTYAISAKIDPILNPDQNSNISGAVTINVINRPPVLTTNQATVTLLEGTVDATTILSATDADNDTVILSLDPSATPVNPIWATFDTVTGTLTVAPPTGTVSVFPIVILANDGFGGLTRRTINITVNPDTIAPVITLITPLPNPVIITPGTAYTDPGSVVTDNVSVGLVAIVTSTLNTAIAGTYTLTYNAIDAAGNAAIPVIRTVIVNNAPVAGRASAFFQQGINGYVGTQDTELRMDTPIENYGTHQSSSIDGTTSPAGAGQDTYMLLQFGDIFGASPTQVPLTATINTASLQMYMSSGGNDVDMHQILSPWQQNTANWNSHATSVDSGTLLRTLIGRPVIGSPLDVSFSSPVFDVTTELQNWAGGTSNFGWGFKPTNLTSIDGVTFATSEDLTTTNRPLLTVDYLANQRAVKTAVNTNITITLSGIDTDIQPLSAKVAVLPATGTLHQTADGLTLGAAITAVPTAVSNAGGQVIFVPALGFSGQTTLSYIVNDGVEDSLTPAFVTVYVDNVSPVITRTGAANVSVPLNAVYVDLGATAVDNVDGNISANIITNNPVNTAIAGLYTVSYNVTDAAGNIATSLTRTVKVNAAPVAGVTTSTFQQGFNGYTSGQDTSLRESLPTTNFNTSTRISIDGGIGLHQIGLLKFGNIFGVAQNQIPSGSAILDASLRLRVSSGGNHVDVRQMQTPWTDNLATWSTHSAAVTASPTLRRWVGRPIAGSPLDISGAIQVFDVYTELQNWSLGAPNHGWGFIPFHTEATDGVDFSSNEYTTTLSSRPELTVTFQNPTITVSTPISTNITLTLGGYDANGDALTAKVTTLPLAGVLYDTTDGVTLGAPITVVPTTVASVNQQVIFVPATNAVGVPYATFDYVINDGTVDSTPATIVIDVNPPLGTTHVWTGATSTTWNVATNWSVGTVPSAASTIFIPTTPVNQPTITVATSITGFSNVVGSTLTINQPLTVANGFTNAGTIALGNSLTITTGTLTNTGTITATGGGLFAPFVNSGTLTVNANTTLPLLFTSPAGGSTINGNGSTLTLSGGVNVDGMTVDNVILTIQTIAPTLFDNVTFQNYLGTATPLLLNYNGATQTFNNLNYNSPFTTGFHIGGVGTGNNITIASTNITGTTNPTFIALGNVVTWPVVAGPATVISTANLNNTPCGVTWALGGSPYLVASNVSIASGCRLQIDPGVVVKFNSGLALTANLGGILDIYGQSGVPVIFTSAKDDTIGGDTNGDAAATVPVPGNWSAINFNQGSGTVSFAEVRYSFEGINMQGASPALNDITILESFYSGLTLSSFSGQTTSPTVTNLTIIDQGINDPFGISIESTVGTGVLNPIFTNVSIDNGNSWSPSIEIRNFGGGGSLTPTFNGVSITTIGITNESILVQGAGSNPVLNNFTVTGGIHGLSLIAGATGSYNNIAINGNGFMTSAVAFEGGSTPSLFTNITLNNADVPYSIKGQALPIITTDYAGGGILFGAGIVDTYSVPTLGVFSQVNTILPADPLSVGSSAYHVTGAISVSTGSRLQIDPYTVMKFSSGTSLIVNGGATLDIYGSPAAPVIMTTVNDDTVAPILPSSTGIPAIGSWSGIQYQASSLGSMSDAHVHYANNALEMTSASPTITNFTATEFAGIGLYLRTFAANHTASPTVTNIVLTTSDTLNQPIFMSASATDATQTIAPIINGTSITTASTSTALGAIHLSGVGVNPTISNMTINGGGYNLYATNNASGVFTNNTFNGATSEAVYLSNNTNGIISINSTNTITNAPAPYSMNQAFPSVDIYASIGVGVVDTYTVHLNGNFNAANSILVADPLNTGASAYLVSGSIAVNNGARLQIDPYTVMKFNSGTSMIVQGGATLDIYGAPNAPVIMTTVNDDTVAPVLATSTGIPAIGSWSGIQYQASSLGSISDAQVHYANNALDIASASPTITNFTATEFAGIGLYLRTFAANHTANPVVSNIVLTTSDTSNLPISMSASATDATQTIAPIINGTSITTASTSTTLGAIHLSGVGVNPTISNMTINGGGAGLLAISNASATVTDSIFRSALTSGVNLNTTGAINLSNNRIVANTTGIDITNVSPTSIIEHNLIRTNTSAGVVVAATQISPGLTLRNNLIVQNGTDLVNNGGVRLLDDPVGLTGANVTLLSNTIANNLGTGLSIDTYATAIMNDNIIANNTADFAVLPIGLAGDYNLTNSGVFPSVGPNITGVIPQFTNAWYLSDGSNINGNTLTISPAVDASINRSAAGVGYLTLNPYAQTSVTDVGQLDIGYHHATTDVTALINPATSTVITDILKPALNGNVIITITPNVLQSGLQIAATITSVGNTVGSVNLPAKDLGDGTYQVVFTASGLPGGLDTVNILVNGVFLGATGVITW